MAFQEIKTSDGRIAEYFPKKASERKAGDFVTGTYKGTREQSRPDGTTDVLYILENNGKTIGVNSSPVIKTKMDQVPEGAVVKIQFDGKERSAKTGREYNNFSVFIDDGDGADEEEMPTF